MKIYVLIPQGMNLPDGATKSCGMESEKGLSDMNRLGFAWLGVRAHVHQARRVKLYYVYFYPISSKVEQCHILVQIEIFADLK